jgi:hypothetical protein
VIGQLAPTAYRLLPSRGRRVAVERLLREQSVRCRRGGSPFYADLLVRAAKDVRRAGPCWRPFADEPFAVALPLRFMAGVHRVVLVGAAPDLARHYPSVGGDGDSAEAWLPFQEAVEAHADVIADSLRRPVQTNEVGRCRALLGGFLIAASEARLPLRLLEIGASAGLNLRWDRYHYVAGGSSWGDPASPVHLLDGYRTAPPYVDVSVTVGERRGCDLAPIDPTGEDGRVTLLSYTWGDQPARVQLLDAAVGVARSVPAEVEAADALEWLPRALERPTEGLATVVFHSYVMQLLGTRGRARLTEVMTAAGRRATRSAPLAWLRYEFADGRRGNVRLSCWPDGTDRTLAVASAHGQNIEWGPVRPVAA